MILKYGSYSFDDNEAAIVISKRSNFSDRGRLEYTRETWTVSGVKHADTQAALTTALAAMRAALQNGYDLALYLGDGTTLTDHYMLNSAARGGVRVTLLDFPKGDGAEYSTFRTYSIQFEADYYNTSEQLVQFDEEITIEGTGGPRKFFIEVLEGPPVEQIAVQRTTYRATQSGSVTGFGAFVQPPAPLWPYAERGEQRKITRSGPKVAAGNRLDYVTKWSYSFESASPLVGNPNVR